MTRARGMALPVAAVSAGLAFLLVRPAIVGFPGAEPALLAIGYVTLAAVALAAPLAADAPGLVAGWRGSTLSLATGVVAVVAARWVVGPGLPVRAGLTAVGLNILAAVAEEAFFRRFLFGSLLRWGAVLAVAGSALAFALVHLPAYGTAAFPVDLGAGLLLSWQRWASGRWEVPAATHAFANLLVVIP